MKSEKIRNAASGAHALKGIPLYLSLAGIFFTVFFIANAYSERFTSKEQTRAGLKVLQNAKTVRIVQNIDLADAQPLELLLDGITRQWFRTADINVVPAEKNHADLILTIEAEPVAASDGAPPMLEGRIRLATPYKEFYNKAFSGFPTSDHDGGKSSVPTFVDGFSRELAAIFDDIFGEELRLKTAHNRKSGLAEPNKSL